MLIPEIAPSNINHGPVPNFPSNHCPAKKPARAHTTSSEPAPKATAQELAVCCSFRGGSSDIDETAIKFYKLPKYAVNLTLPRAIVLKRALPSMGLLGS